MHFCRVGVVIHGLAVPIGVVAAVITRVAAVIGSVAAAIRNVAVVICRVARVLRHTAGDWSEILCVSLVLGAAAVLASCLPARRAAALDPVQALVPNKCHRAVTNHREGPSVQENVEGQ